MAHIWVPNDRIVEVKQAVTTPPSKAAGFFSLRGSLPDGRSRVIAAPQPNLVLDAGLEAWGTLAPIVNFSVGSSNQLPEVTDTAIVSFVAQNASITQNTQGAQALPPYYGWQRWTARFNPPGTNRILREVAVGWGTNGADAWARSLIKDDFGLPIDVTWLANETLDFSYECRFYPFGITYGLGGEVIVTDHELDFTCSGQTHHAVIRPAQVTLAGDLGGWQFWNGKKAVEHVLASSTYFFSPYVYNGDIREVTSKPSGAEIFYGPYDGGWTEVDAYLSGSRKRTGTYVFSPTKGNLDGGISAIMLQSNGGTYQFSVTPPIMKVVDWELTLHVETPEWGRYPG